MSTQLVTGRTGQAYSQRKGGKSAFWEDLSHATALETNEYLMRSLWYIGLSLVRAGVVAHPQQWPVSGYREVQPPTPLPHHRRASVNGTARL